MSVKVSSWVWHGAATKEVNGNEMILLLALADVADDNGRCRFVEDEDDLTYDALARKVRVDRRTIERLIPKLRARGLVDQVKGTKAQPNEFRVLVPWGPGASDDPTECPDKLSVNGSDSPTAVQLFPDNDGGRTSLKRIDVINDQFETFWEVYPRHVAKAAARTKFLALAKKHDPQLIVDGARRYAADPNLPEKQYIPHPTTWLNQGRWDDEPLPPRTGQAALVAPEYQWMYDR